MVDDGLSTPTYTTSTSEADDSNAHEAATGDTTEQKIESWEATSSDVYAGAQRLASPAQQVSCLTIAQCIVVAVDMSTSDQTQFLNLIPFVTASAAC